MKLLKLTISNIASVTAASIDFTAEPLASASVYLITGNTGSGKTTILDSICLALYGTTPRLQRLAEGGHKSVELTDGSKYTDSRAMARRDSVEATAELEFIGNDGIHYSATWTTARPYKKQGKPFRTPAHFLRFTENGREVVIDKVAPLRERIERAVGLDFKKFCRTTMLAQGDFTRFLQAPNDEKSEILEKITGTDVYRRISIKIRENYKTRKDAANELERQLADIVLLSNEELDAAKAELHTLERTNVELKAQSDSLMKGIIWLENETVMTAQLAELRKALTEAEEFAKSDRIANQKELIAQYDLTEKPRRWSAEAADARKEREKAIHDLDELAAHALDLRGGLEYLRLSVDANRRKANELKTLIDLEQPNAEVYSRQQLIVSKLSSLDAGRESLAGLNSQLASIAKSIENNLLKAVEKAAADLAAAKDAQQAIRQSIDDNEAILEAKHPERIREVLDALKNEKQKVERRQQITRLQKEVADARAQLQKLADSIGALRIVRDKAKALYEHERESVDALIRKLRGDLTAGCRCPLCRQTVTELPVEHDIELLIVGYEKSYREADENVRNHEAEMNRLTAKIEVTQKSIDSEETGLNEPLRSLEAINGEIASVEKLLEEINALSVKIRESGQQLKQATALTEKCSEALNAANSAVNVARTKEATLRGQAASVAAAIEALEAEILSLTAGYAAPMSPLQKPADYAAKLTQATQSYNRAVETLNELNRHITATKEEFARNMAIIDGLNLPCDSRVSPMKLPDLDSQVGALNAKVAATRRALADSETKIKQAREQIASFMAENNLSEFILQNLLQLSAVEVAGARRDIAAASDNLLKARTSLDEALKRYDAHKANRPEALDGDLPVDALKQQKLKADEDAVEVNRRIGVITQRLTADSQSRTTHAERLRLLNEKRTEEQRWKQLDELFGDTNGKKFVNIAQTYVLMDLIDSANKYMSTLSDRYRLRVEPNSFVIYVDDAYDGGSSRPTNTISGGESFLLSLALALALSDIAEGLEVDTLFIDEGFGTLSGKPLKDAIATLAQLHSQTGRHIGIISHVEELRNELPVQIRVVQNPQTSDSHLEITG